MRGKGYENEETAADIPSKQACKEATIERERDGKGVKMKEWLQTFLKKEP